MHLSLSLSLSPSSLSGRYELVYTRSLGPTSGSLVLLPPPLLPLPSSFDRVIAPSRGNFCSLSLSLPLSFVPSFPVGEKEALRIPLRRLPLIQLAPRLRGGRQKHLRDLYPPESGRRRRRGCAAEKKRRERRPQRRSQRRDRRSRSPQRAHSHTHNAF